MARKQTNTPALEWIAALIGLVLILLVAGVIGRQAISGEIAEPPAIEVRVLRVAAAGNGFVVAFEAVNRSGATAAAVAIEGTLGPSSAPIETSTASLDYVPGHGKVEGGLFFSRDPRTQPLAVRALGYQMP